MPPTRRITSKTIHHLKVTLLYIEPPVWRRLHVPSAISLTSLHRVLQVALGWQNQHLYQFQVGTLQLWASAAPAVGITLTDVAATPGARFVYCYDFGDGWEHEVVVETVTPPEPGVRYPTCVAGARACPPEDCGGPPGYARVLEVSRDPRHPDHDEIAEWLGGPFDPEKFDRQETNRRLRTLRIT